MRISDWSSDVCSSDLHARLRARIGQKARRVVLVARIVFGMPLRVVLAHVQPDFGGYVPAGPHNGVGHRRVGGITRAVRTVMLVPHLGKRRRSEGHTSELQSLMRNSYAVFCLKKKTE